VIAALSDHSPAAAPRLRIGVLLDSPSLPRCQAAVLDHIAGSDFASVVLAVFNADAPGRPDACGRARMPGLLFRLYQRWDRRHVRAADDPLAPVDCTATLGSIETLTVSPDAACRVPAEALARIRQAKLDVLIRFGFGTLRGEILTAARCGVWSYRYGTADGPGGATYFWEMRDSHPLSLAGLQWERDDHAGANPLLSLGVFATHPSLSLAETGFQPYWGAATFVIEKLRELHERGWQALERRLTPAPSGPDAPPAPVPPTSADMARWLVPMLPGKTLRKLTRRHPIVSYWRLGIRQGDRGLPDAGPRPGLDGFQWIDGPPGRYFADPFLLEEGGTTWLFFEEFNYRLDRARLVCAPLGPDGRLGDVTPVLDRPYHLSYPCLIRDGGELFMIPETSGHETVDLYRCRRFPDQWDHERELFRGHVVDTTVWIENGRYWFFATIADPPGWGTELWLFSASSLTGTWTPHPANPISTDIRDCRCAGAIFRHDGRLIRPAQNGTGGYGSRFALNEIVTLTPDEFEERPLVAPDPPAGFEGTHTYSRAGRFEIIDGLTYIPLQEGVGSVLHRSGRLGDRSR
jgi:hypothetical protein